MQKSIDKTTGEVIRRNSFIISPSLSTKGRDLSDDVVDVYELKDFVISGASGEDSDFTIEKRPVLVDKYHLNKVVEERCKGCDLKSIIARVEKTGDLSLLNQKKAVYGDAFKQPDNLSDALQIGVETSNFLDSLSEKEKEEYMKLAKMPKDEYEAYIKSLEEARKSNDVKKQEETPQPKEVPPEKGKE